MGVHPVIIHLRLGFSMIFSINHPFGGTRIDGNPHFLHGRKQDDGPVERGSDMLILLLDVATLDKLISGYSRILLHFGRRSKGLLKSFALGLCTDM